MVLQGHVANKNHHISITRVSMAIKLGRMIASLDGHLPIMLHNPLITWPCEIEVHLQEEVQSSPTSCLKILLNKKNKIKNFHFLFSLKQKLNSKIMFYNKVVNYHFQIKSFLKVSVFILIHCLNKNLEGKIEKR